MLINKQHIVLEASVQMRFQAQRDDDRVVVAVDVGVDAVEALEDLAEEGWEGFREGDACGGLLRGAGLVERRRGWEEGFCEGK